jgi:NitT/TauT family transport system substrate-binding protein
LFRTNASDEMKRSTLITGAAAAFTAPPRILRSQPLTKISLVGAQTLDMTPVFYALHSGMYEGAGLDVELVPASSGTFATTAVVAGTYQMGKGSCIASLVAHLRGLPLKVVANGGIWDPKTPFTLSLVAADSPLRTGADLNGKTGGTGALNDMNQLSITAWIDKNGGDSKTVKWVEVPNTAAAAALLEKRIDVTALNEPQLTAALETGKFRVLAPTYSAIAEHFVFATYFANAQWADANRDAVRRWVRTTYRSAAYTNAHNAETEALVAQYTKIPVETIRKISRGSGSVSSDPALIQPAIDVAAKYNYIPRVFSAKELYFG